MTLMTLIFLALGLSMDAFAVSITNGLCLPQMPRRQMFKIAFAFGFFQALMPICGYIAGQTVSGAISGIDHYIALILLGLIGGKMIIDGIRDLRQVQTCERIQLLSNKMLLMQAIATSIDALAVGISLAVMQVNIVSAAALIGIITFLCSLIGIAIGRRFGDALQAKAELVGGLILVVIGLKIFLEHTLG